MSVPVLLFFDDGSREDLIVANLLARRKLKGVFGIPLRSVDTQLSREDIVKLASVGEIASHSITHKNLVKLAKVDHSIAWRELYYSRAYLEKIIGRPVTTFVYPYGVYNTTIKKLAKEAGYLFARTMDPYNTSLRNVAIHSYEVPITLSHGRPDRYQIARAILNFYVKNKLSGWLFKESIRLSIAKNEDHQLPWLELILQLLKKIAMDPNSERDVIVALVFHSKKLLNSKDQVTLFKAILDFIAYNSEIFKCLTAQDLITQSPT
jgi:hypothetical protein